MLVFIAEMGMIYWVDKAKLEWGLGCSCTDNVRGIRCQKRDGDNKSIVPFILLRQDLGISCDKWKRSTLQLKT